MTQVTVTDGCHYAASSSLQLVCYATRSRLIHMSIAEPFADCGWQLIGALSAASRHPDVSAVRYTPIRQQDAGSGTTIANE